MYLHNAHVCASNIQRSCKLEKVRPMQRYARDAFHALDNIQKHFIYNTIGVNITLSGVNSRFFRAPSRFSLKMSRFFAYFDLEKMRSMRSSKRQVELRRLGNQLQVLGKVNSLCEVGNISLQFDRAT